MITEVISFSFEIKVILMKNGEERLYIEFVWRMIGKWFENGFVLLNESSKGDAFGHEVEDITVENDAGDLDVSGEVVEDGT